MMRDLRERWDSRHASAHEIAPDRFVVDLFDRFVRPAFPHGGTAIDIAGGAGRHSVFLAERGWRVTMIDISQVGVERALAAAERRSCTLNAVVADTATFDFGRARFDLVLVVLYLERALFPRLTAALRPGGLLLYRTFTREHEKFLTHTSTPDFFLDPGELAGAFPELDTLHFDESGGMASLVARKPVR